MHSKHLRPVGAVEKKNDRSIIKKKTIPGLLVYRVSANQAGAGAGASPGFLSMKQIGVFLLSPTPWMRC